MDDFRSASTLVPLGGDVTSARFVWEVPDGWQQGKGAFGGLVIGALARAMLSVEGWLEPATPRRLRSISAELCAPLVPGRTAVRVTVLRRGRALTYLEARAIRDGEVVARASGLVGGPRPPSALALETLPHRLPAPATIAPAPIVGGPSPRFAARYEFRSTAPLPFAGAREAVCAGWVRERAVAAAPRPLDDADVIGLLDAWWPCALVVEPGPRPMATVAFTAELLVDPATLDPAAPFAYRAHVAGAADGYSVELRHLWQGDRLVALNQQTFAAL